MKIAIFGAGSRGDIQPCVVLGRGLQQAGYTVRLAVPENFVDFVGAHGLEVAPLRGDVQAVMAGETGRAFMQTGGANPLKSIRTIRTLIAPIVMEMTQDLRAACRDVDALICLGVFSVFGHAVAEALDMPILHVEPTPLLPSRAFPAPSWPLQKGWGGLHNYLSGLAMLGVIWLWYRPFVNDFRRNLGLPKLGAIRAYRTFRSTPMIGAYSPQIIPHPADWPASVHVTGYLFLDDLADWQPPPELVAFLAAGDAPIYIGFGSMAGQNPEELARLVAEALAQCGQRGVLLTGWGGLRVHDVPAHVCVVESAPHSWLFPRMAAVVHHGGAGTTAEGVRAGVPTVVVPFVMDQPFWGARLNALGLGPVPIPIKKLTAQGLAAAIHTAVTDSAMRRRAAACGDAIRAEEGVGNAVQVIRDCLGAPGMESEGNR